MNEPFELLVKRMRDAQKRFFKVHGTDALELSRKLEKEVDARIEEMTVGPNLFCESTNLEALTKNPDTFADWLSMHAMCDFCPARFGTCQEQTDHALCRLNWRDWLAEKAKPEDGR